MKIPEHVRASEAWKTLTHKRRCKYGAALNGLTTGMIFSFNHYESPNFWNPDYGRDYRDLLLVDVAIRGGELMLLCRNLQTGNSIEYSWAYYKSNKITIHGWP